MRVRSCDFTPVCDLCTIDPFPIPPSTQNFREDAPFPPFISTDRFFSLSPLRLLWKQQRSARARRVSRSLISRVVPLGSCTQVSRDSSVAGDLIVSLSRVRRTGEHTLLLVALFFSPWPLLFPFVLSRC